MRDRSLRILLIEDDEDDQVMFNSIISEIKAADWKVDWCVEYQAGLELLKKDEHDICFLDYRLGHQSGLELLRAAVQAGSRTPIVLLTGYGETEIDRDAMRLGAADYLVKDQINATIIERCVRYAIHRAETLSALRDREAQVLMQDRLASVGLLASSLAHEIGTPLGVVRGRAELLALQLKDNETIRKNADIIIAQIDRVSVLIRSLLQLARGEGSHETSAVHLNEVVKEVGDLLEHVFSKNEIQFKTRLPAAVRICAESSALHQVLLNLFVNSVHAIESAIAGGRDRDHFIEVSAREDGAFWSVEVLDTGCGISESNFRHLFKPFFTTRDVGSGTGLGLVSCYRIIESWGGTIEVESKEGAGATFRLLIPKAFPIEGVVP